MALLSVGMQLDKQKEIGVGFDSSLRKNSIFRFCSSPTCEFSSLSRAIRKKKKTTTSEPYSTSPLEIRRAAGSSYKLLLCSSHE